MPAHRRPALDAYVARQVLDAVAPAALEVSMAAAAQAEDERADAGQAVAAAARARAATPPTAPAASTSSPNRRTASSPGSSKPTGKPRSPRRAQLEAEYQRFTEQTSPPASPAERAAIQALAADLPQVWDAPSTTRADRKELLRILIEDITVTVDGDSELVDVNITWAGGHQTSGQAVRPVARLDQLSYYPALLARVTGLAAAGRNNRQIADALNAEGFRPPKRTSRFTGQQVRTLISQRGIRARPRAGPPCSRAWPQANGRSPACPPSWACPPPASTTGSTAAGSPPATPPEPGTGSSPPTSEQMRQLRERRARPPGYYTRARWAPPNRNRNPTRNKEHSHEKAAQLDRYQRWPTSVVQRIPATLTKMASGTGRGL